MRSIHGTSSSEKFRFSPNPTDPMAVETLVRSNGVFTSEEIAIARELVEEALAKGEDGAGYHFVFADGDHGLDGYSCYGPIPATKGRFELYWIAVRKAVQRTKLASRLLQASEDGARGLGAVMMIAETSSLPSYLPAQRFYAAQGYDLLADIADWHADGDGLMIFAKRLDREGSPDASSHKPISA